MMKHIIGAMLSFVFSITVSEAETGSALSRAEYLSLSKGDKLNHLMRNLGLSNQGTVFDNLQKTSAFKLTESGADLDAAACEIFSAAKKTQKQFELDTRENGTALRAVVLFDSETPWAVLLAKTQIFANSGTVSLQPVAIYSIERNSAGEVLVRIPMNLEFGL